MKLPLILLPGLLCDDALWVHQMKALKNVADCQVPNLSQYDSMPALARSVLQKAPPKFALAGLSMGGYVAFEIMRQAPERVSRLFLLDTSARPDTPEQLHKRQTFINMTRVGEFKGVTPRLLPLLIHTSRLKDEMLTDTIYGMAGRIGAEAYVRQQTSIMTRTDSRPLLPLITCPTHVLGGHQDRLTPPDVVREIAEGIPGAQLDILENCGHLSALEQPEKVNALMLAWLKSSSSST